MLFASRFVEGALLLWAAVGKTLGLRLLLVELTLGSFARDAKIYDVRHSSIHFPDRGAELLSAVSPDNIERNTASSGYFEEDCGEISIHGWLKIIIPRQSRRE